ncbi:MAG: hypothetical protein HZA50_15005 [Planctomycetes bacterium]|nr:hypothetical protein [Planctomycetota bacterium]
MQACIIGRTKAIILVAAMVCMAHCGVLFAQTESSRPSASQAAPAAASQSGQPATKEADHASRIASNFVVLLKNNRFEMVKFVGKIILSAVLWCILMLLAGVAVGLIAFFTLRHFKIFDANWNWYCRMRWLWVVLFLLSTSAGFAYAGVWLGIGRAVNGGIRDGRVLDRMVGQIFVAVAMDQADYQMTDDENAGKLDKVLAESEAAGKISRREWQQIKHDIAEVHSDGFWERMLIRETMERSMYKITEICSADPRLVVAVFMPGSDTNAYLEKHKDAKPAVMAISGCFQNIRDAACDGVDKLVKPNIYIGILVGLGLPLVLAGLFQISVRLTRTRQNV